MKTIDRPTILVVEDDRALAVGLDLNLTAEGFEVVLAGDGGTALAVAETRPPDLMLLDLRLPDLNGLDVLADIRARGRRYPVIVLSARGEEEDKIAGLNIGADDYVTKPFALGELVARIKAAIRRSRDARARVVRVGRAELDLDRRVLLLDGRVHNLTAREFDLLAFLVDNSGRALSRETLLTAVWGYDYEGTSRTIDNFVSNLRRRIEPNPAFPRHLVTVHGVGYRLDLE